MTSFWPWLAGTLMMFGWSIYLLILGWGKWPDLLIDFGRELYIPWQLSLGKVLYQDIYFYYGPLSKYFYAFFFKLFSPSFFLLILINLFVLIFLAYLLFKALRVFASSRASWLALAFFFSLFPFSQYVGIGNYNYMTPYAHGLVHGLVLSLAGFVLLMKYFQKPSPFTAFGAGCVTSFVFLVKVEAFAAWAGALLAGVVIRVLTDRIRRSHLLLFLIGAVVPVILFWWYFFIKMGGGKAFEVMFLPYASVFAAKVQGNNLYQVSSGMGNVGASLMAMARALLSYGGMALSVFLLARACTRWRHGWFQGMVVAGGTGLVGYVFSYHVPLFEVFRPLLVIALAGVIFFGNRVLHGRRSEEMPGGFIFSIFATLWLMKELLYGHIHHYGFVLAVPAVMLGVVLFFDHGVASGVRKGADQKVMEFLFIVVLLTVAYVYGQVSRYYYAHKNFFVGESFDKIGAYTSAQTEALSMAVAYLNSIPAGATVAVLPEGVMLNYLARKSNPTPFFEFAPGFFNMVPQEDVLDRFKEFPPDFIVMVDRDMREYGYRFFARDYATVFLPWIIAHYETVWTVGDVPFSEKKFWVWIGRRKDIQ